MSTPETVLAEIRSRRGRTTKADDRGLQDTRGNAQRTDRVGDSAEQGYAKSSDGDGTEDGLLVDAGRGSGDRADGSEYRGSDDSHGVATGRDTAAREVDKPVGLEFADPGGAEYTLPDIPQIPPASKIRNRRNEVKDSVIPDSVAGGDRKLSVGGIGIPLPRRKADQANRSGASESVSGVQSSTKRITGSEADELRENLSEMIQGISELADALREAWWGKHPIADEVPLFTLEQDENTEAVKWLLRRGEKSPKMAQRIRVTTDLYDSFAVPASILFPRIVTAIREIREQGISIRGR